MKNAVEFECQVTDGRLPEHEAKLIGAAIRKLDGKRVVVSVGEVQKTRSGQQNRYYWGCLVWQVTAAFRDAGNLVNQEEVHDFLKTHVGKLSQVIVSPDGEVFRAPASTARLTTQEFSDYIEAVRAWASEVLNLAIPSPDEFNQQERTAI